MSEIRARRIVCSVASIALAATLAQIATPQTAAALHVNNNSKGDVKMIPEVLPELMRKDGVVAIATLGEDGPHMVNTWNTYLRMSEDGRLLIPAGYMNRTEANIAHNPQVLITIASSKVKGLHGQGAGCLIKGKAEFVTSGPEFDLLKRSFDWLRATVAVTIESATQTW